MAEGLNRVMLLGNLGDDPKFFPGREGGVLRIRIACSESWFDKQSNERKERTEWVNVVVFGRRAEALEKILRKGSSIFVEGRLQTSSYEKDGVKQYSTDVVATNVLLTGGKPAGGEDRRDDRRDGRSNDSRGGSRNGNGGGYDRGGGAGGSRRNPPPDDDRGGYDPDDDIPFVSQLDDIARRWR